METLKVESVRPGVRNRQRGFTLIEVLIVIVIISVMLMIAVPSFVNFTASQRVKTASFDLYAAMTFARSEAIKRRQPVTVKPPSGTDWGQGWSVFFGAAPVNPCPQDGTASPPNVLRCQGSLSGVVISGPASVIYRQDGRLTSASALNILVQPQTAHASIQNRCIRIDLTGVPKSTTTSSSTCL